MPGSRKRSSYSFDTYGTESLKNKEREKRGESAEDYVIDGPDQRPTESSEKLMKNSKFKDELGKFFVKEWQEEKYTEVISGKVIVTSNVGTCIQIHATAEKKIIAEEPAHLQSSHEEADTLIAFQVRQVEADVIVRASDTDILALLIAMIGGITEGEVPTKYGRILMDSAAGNKRRYIDVTSIQNKIGAGTTWCFSGFNSFARIHW